MNCSDGEIHLWKIDLDGQASASARLRKVLTPEESARAERFRVSAVRERWIAAHGALRFILAEYVGQAPERLVFSRGLHGKPELTGASARDVAFNLTHTDGVAMVGVTSGAQIGVDAEIVRVDADVEDLSRRFFAKEEAAEILSLRDDQRLAAFYRCWCRKEALVKAVGGGLSIALNSFRVSVLHDEPARLISGRDLGGSWNFIDVSETGIAAAVVVEGSNVALTKIEFAFPKCSS